MRLVGVLLSVTLLGSPVFADDGKPAEAAAPAARVKVPLRVVRVLPETNQALLFDRTKGTHVLVEVGEAIEGYTVDDIDTDEVTLLSEAGATVVLAAPDQSWRRHGETAARPAAAPKKAEPAPQDPYAEEPVRSVQAPDAAEIPTDPSIRSVQAPSGSTAAAAPTSAPSPSTAAVTDTATATGAVTDPAAVTAPAPAPVPARAPAPTHAAPAPSSSADGAAALAAALTGGSDSAPTADAPAAEPTAPKSGVRAARPSAPSSSTTSFALPRADVNAALSDFAGTAASFHASFTPTGLRLDSVSSASILAKAGLRANDTILAVDNQPLRSIDDAANLYARASTARALTVQITRDSKPLTLHIAIQ